MRAFFRPTDISCDTRAQRYIRDSPLPVYVVEAQAGPAHAPTFRIRVHVPGYEDVIGMGNATSKSKAREEAARHVISQLYDLGDMY